jgi:response regulator receiver modulated CheW protein
MAATTALDEALKRTNLSRSNQMEMLTFRFSDGQLYGINVLQDYRDSGKSPPF